MKDNGKPSVLLLRKSKVIDNMMKSHAYMLVFCLSIVLLLTFSCLVYAGISEDNEKFKQGEKLKKQAVEFIKKLPVSRLDKALSDRSFSTWFQTLVGKNIKIDWELNDCGEQTGTAADAGRDFPACVEAYAVLDDNRKVFVMIVVGTFNKGIFGDPIIWNGGIITGKRGYLATRKLSELQDALLEKE